MDNRPLGVFDSGVGGLTVLRELRQVLPQESFIYFGDTARVPYGNKGAATVLGYARESCHFLIEKGVKAIVVACNTASAFALTTLQEEFSLPIIGVVAPGASQAVRVTTRGRIAVLGTRGTIDSGVYEKEIKRLMPTAAVYMQPCPLFVSLVEEGYPGRLACRMIVEDYLQSVLAFDGDTLLLGCTHYPLLVEDIRSVIPSEMNIVDSGFATAEALAFLLESEGLSGQSEDPSCSYYVSDDPARFEQLSRNLLRQIEIEAQLQLT